MYYLAIYYPKVNFIINFNLIQHRCFRLDLGNLIIAFKLHLTFFYIFCIYKDI